MGGIDDYGCRMGGIFWSEGEERYKVEGRFRNGKIQYALPTIRK